MKKLFVLLMAFAITTTVAVAQNKTESTSVAPNDNMATAREYAEALQKKLDLTDEQKEKIYTLKLHTLQKNNRVEKAFSADPAKMEKQKSDIQRDFHSSMESILTPEQMKLWDRK